MSTLPSVPGDYGNYHVIPTTSYDDLSAEYDDLTDDNSSDIVDDGAYSEGFHEGIDVHDGDEYHSNGDNCYEWGSDDINCFYGDGRNTYYIFCIQDDTQSSVGVST
eukprot:9468854-Pyramimonas_sp.AAC.1